MSFATSLSKTEDKEGIMATGTISRRQAESAASRVDPVTLEVMRARLMSIVREMSVTLYRTSYSTIIREVHDFSCVLLDRRSRLVAQAEGIPLFNGSMGPVLEGVLRKFSLEDFEPGDVIISNDPYKGGGTHKNDVNIVMPIFHDGQLVLFSASKCHYTDIGGKDPGSWSGDARNTFQEGLMIPPVKLFEGGKRNEAVFDMFFANIRTPEWSRGDLAAQVAAGKTAERRVLEFLDRYGWPTASATIEALMDHGERVARAHIEKIPDGIYRAECFIDSDGVVDEPVALKLKVTVKGSDITFDFTGSASQRGGACGNEAWVATVSVCRETVIFLAGASLSANEGSYRPIHVIAPEGTIVRPLPPAPVTTGIGDVGTRVIELILQALAPVIPDKVIAGTFGCVQVMSIAGTDPRTGKEYVHFSPYAGGWGGRAKNDGNGAMVSLLSGDNYNIPCEVMETKFPLTAERFTLREGSAGAGRHRGGLGMRYDYRMLADGEFLVSMDRDKFPPHGLFNGKAGLANVTVVNPGTSGEKRFAKVAGYSVKAGTIISHQTAGGGGYGDPLERDPQMVLADVRNEYLSLEVARTDYGVAIDPIRWAVDEAETARLRERAAR
jgi:N-methylhydantoinase B